MNKLTFTGLVTFLAVFFQSTICFATGTDLPLLLSRNLDISQGGRFSNFDPRGILPFQRTSNRFELCSGTVFTRASWFGYFWSGAVVGSARFRIRIFEDDGGLPGEIVYDLLSPRDGHLDELRGGSCCAGWSSRNRE